EFAAAYARHGRLVAGAPGERERAGVDAQGQRVDLALDRSVPVDDRAEDVEGQNRGRRDGHGTDSLRSLPRQTFRRASSRSPAGTRSPAARRRSPAAWPTAAG